MVCECKEGYSGSRCDVCADNYYGNPDVPGGVCVPCDCSGKINLKQGGNCDPHTGKCLRCLDNTTGDHCEVCREGFFRYSDDSPCQGDLIFCCFNTLNITVIFISECECNPLGTNFTTGQCNPNGGQCQCYPNVSGVKCNECEPNHWKIASGQGCEPCDCDESGSLSTQCNLVRMY